MSDVNNYYLEVLTPEDECAKHGKEWMFMRKNPPSTNTHIYVSEYTYICLACLWDNIDKFKEENKRLKQGLSHMGEQLCGEDLIKEDCLRVAKKRDQLKAKLQEIKEWATGLSNSVIPVPPGCDQLTSEFLGAILIEIVEHPTRLVVDKLKIEETDE